MAESRVTNDILEDILRETVRTRKVIESWQDQDKHYHRKTLKKMRK